MPELLRTIIAVLKLPNTGLRDEAMSLVTNHLALSESSLSRLTAVQLLELVSAEQHFSRAFFKQLFSEVIFSFRREQNKQVV